MTNPSPHPADKDDSSDESNRRLSDPRLGETLVTDPQSPQPVEGPQLDPGKTTNIGSEVTRADEPPGPRIAVRAGTAFAQKSEENDIALAGVLLDSGVLSERQLHATFADWSIHGSESLADHVRRARVLSDQQIDQFEQQAREQLRQQPSIPVNGFPPTGSLVQQTLERIDPSGRIAKLLGLAAFSGAVCESTRVSSSGYELVRKLGQGGLGRVWLARDTKMQRLVALKEITEPSTASDATVARFRHEAEITGRLEHPGIVPVYQLGDDPSTGAAFYTMRFLGKGTLQDSITIYHERREEGDHDPMLLRHLLTAFVSICHAIGHAHSRRVIHRDLKPENIVIDGFGQVIVIDWGLAKLLDDAEVQTLGESELSGQAGTTQDGQILGTPLYMAPEQAAGRLDEIDERTDIYGLGAILFAIISGHPPHGITQQKSINTTGGTRTMITEIASGPTPSAHDYHPDVDRSLSAICARAMAKRRYARYQEAADLAEDVQRWMAGEPVSAYRENLWQQTRRWVSAHERLSQAIAAIIAILVAAGFTLAVSARQDRLSQRASRFEQLKSAAREVRLQLESSVADLSSDTRFMSGLPPIQGIIRAQQGVEGDDESVWRDRLETIYTGLLHAETDYLAIAYVAINGDGSKELVRVERNVSDPSFVRVLPASRLFTFDTDVFMGAVAELEPGETLVAVDPRPRQNTRRKEKRLAVGVPIYSDITGAAFGMVVIESNLTGILKRSLEELGAIDGELYVADDRGQLWAMTGPGGVSIPQQDHQVDQIATWATNFFANPDQLEVTDSNSYHASRIFIDPDEAPLSLLVRSAQ